MDNDQQKELIQDLIRAVKDNQFVLYYQPQFNLDTSKFEGMEALIRWSHPRRGLMMPQDFLHLAEETGLIVRIGEWVLKTACEQNKKWQNMGFPALRIAVNVAGKQFQQHNFVSVVMDILKQCNLDPKYLELEVTENFIVQNDETIVNNIKELKQAGVSIALDDFGTGYSSISHLKKIPVDRIKIDKSYIQNINDNNDDAAIVKAIIVLAKALNLQVLAEGVETLKQLQMLMFNECKEVQGFYFSKPLPAAEVEKLLQSEIKKLSGKS